jgi:hypothetical protein
MTIYSPETTYKLDVESALSFMNRHSGCFSLENIYFKLSLDPAKIKIDKIEEFIVPKCGDGNIVFQDFSKMLFNGVMPCGQGIHFDLVELVCVPQYLRTPAEYANINMHTNIKKDCFEYCVKEGLIVAVGGMKEEDHKGQIYNAFTDSWSWF